MKSSPLHVGAVCSQSQGQTNTLFFRHLLDKHCQALSRGVRDQGMSRVWNNNGTSVGKVSTKCGTMCGTIMEQGVEQGMDHVWKWYGTVSAYLGSWARRSFDTHRLSRQSQTSHGHLLHMARRCKSPCSCHAHVRRCVILRGMLPAIPELQPQVSVPTLRGDEALQLVLESLGTRHSVTRALCTSLRLVGGCVDHARYVAKSTKVPHMFEQRLCIQAVCNTYQRGHA